MQDKPIANSNSNPPPAASSMPMPTPITPLGESTDQGGSQTLDQDSLVSMLKKADEVGSLPLSQHPPIDATGLAPGRVITPTNLASTATSAPSLEPTAKPEPETKPAISILPLKPAPVRQTAAPIASNPVAPPQGPPPLAAMSPAVAPVPKPASPVAPAPSVATTPIPATPPPPAAVPRPAPAPVAAPPTPVAAPKPTAPPKPAPAIPVAKPPAPKPISPTPAPAPISDVASVPKSVPQSVSLKPAVPKTEAVASKPRRQFNFHWPKLRHFMLGEGATWVIGSLVVLLLILLAVPTTRYNLAAFVEKRNYTIRVLDSTTGLPVSGATVSTANKTAITNQNGVATLNGLRPGGQTLSVSKAYYDGNQATETVPILNQKKVPAISLHANGSLMLVTVTSKVGGQPLRSAHISASGVEGMTDSSGRAVLSLPSSQPYVDAKLTLHGYVDIKETHLKVSPGSLARTNVALTPSGKVYYLAAENGGWGINSVNMDGSVERTVEKPTGYERSNSQLISSPDNLYQALRARRTADPHDEVYVHSPRAKGMAEIDFGQASFNIYGWIGDTLIYSVVYDNTPPWEGGKVMLKSYDANTEITKILFRGSGVGGGGRYAYQTLADVSLADGVVYYGVNWTGTDNSLLSGKSNSLTAILPDGSSSAVAAQYDASSYKIDYTQPTPHSLYLRRVSLAGGADQFFTYAFGSSQPQQAGISLSDFNQSYPQFYLSSSARSAWKADNVDSVALGDKWGENVTTLSNTTGYDLDGWYGTQYLLLHKGSRLYIANIDGGPPVMIAGDYAP